MTTRRNVLGVITATLAAMGGMTALLTLLSWPAPALAGPAATIRCVEPEGNFCSGPCGPCYSTIQEAVDDADPGDEIRVAQGRYTGVSAHVCSGQIVTQVVYISRTVTIRGGYTTTNWTTPSPTSQPTTLDAKDKGRVIYLCGASPTLEGLRLSGGSTADSGGAVRGYWAHPTISACLVFDNAAEYGGGISLASCDDALLAGNRVFSNTATSHGGGLHLVGSDPITLAANLVFSNTAGWRGGGVYLFGDNATLMGNQIYANRTYTEGGGIALRYGGHATLADNLVFSNTAKYGGGVHLYGCNDDTLASNEISTNTATAGGGIYLHESDRATLADNQVYSNVATTYYGGGVYLLTCEQATLTGNQVRGNTAGLFGGGIGVWDCTASTLSGNTVQHNSAAGGDGLLLRSSTGITLTNEVVSENPAAGVGAGLLVFDAEADLIHTTIARNGGGTGDGIVANYSSTVRLTNTVLVSQDLGIRVSGGSTATLEATLWGQGAWANRLDWGGSGTIATGTIHVRGDPAFVDPDNGDYHIGPGSAAIDAGVPTGITDDIDGDPRPIGPLPDLGADEAWKWVFLPLVLRAY